MRTIWIVLLLSVAIVSCRDMQPKAQDWVVSAPEKTAVGVSCHLGWILERPDLRKLIANHPLFDQALELFLDRAQIDPSSETGRVSAYVIKIPDINSTNQSADSLRDMALIQIAGFRDPKAIQRVVVESFPPEGSLKIGNREYPLFVVLDFNRVQARIFSDSDGRLWIGDLSGLQELARRRNLGEGSSISQAFEWVAPAGVLQGFVQPELIPRDTFSGFSDFALEGIHGLAWAVSPSKKDEKLIDLDLVVTGTGESISKLKPWMQRLIALASSLSGNGARQPDTIQENNRLGIRCQFQQDQLGNALSLINLQEIVRIPIDGAFSAPPKSK
ncbi:MAG: hypothetical protein FWG02_01530 [Holophagaceae bacterium]|nr:hypothetical protein [Holophagaceae bacterium]